MFVCWILPSALVIDEEDVSAEQPPTEADAWIPSPHGDTRRPPGAEAAARQAPEASDGHDPAEAAGLTLVSGRFTFPKAARVRRRRDFLRLQREGRRRHTTHFVVIRRPGEGAESRLGVTVSSRVGNAVVRNRIKRLVRDVFRRRRMELPVPTDVVVIAKPGADALTHAQAATEFARALELVRSS